MHSDAECRLTLPVWWFQSALGFYCFQGKKPSHRR
nr:MAG TPA: hypothetical protein [Caudoviricetes sp.]